MGQLLLKFLVHLKMGTLLSVFSKKIKNIPFQFIIRDIIYKFKYGPDAPAYAECIWVDPRLIIRSISPQSVKAVTGRRSRKASGMVIDFAVFLKNTIDVADIQIVNFCINHWVNGLSWEKTGIYEYMKKLIAGQGMVDSCRNMDDLIERYKKLDIVFNMIKKEGRFRTQKEINIKNFRESGGIYIHIGPGGEPIFGWGGCHRFAIAKVLGLRFPAQIGCVHPDAIPFLPGFRKK